MPTVPTADEILDRSFRRAAKKMQEKENKERANTEFVRAVGAAIHDRMVYIIRGFPEFEKLPPFYREMADILFGIDRIKQSLGAVGWAAKHTKMVGNQLVLQSRRAEDTQVIRKRAVARLASMVHQIDKDLHFLNEVRNTLRQLPHVEDAFTVVIAGYPNVGKSSFIRRVSSAEPEVASYPFTTKGIIVGHRNIGRGTIQFVDTPGILDRPAEERNAIEKQALSAMMNIASVVLFILDPSEHCGYPMEMQLRLLEDVKGMVRSPVIVVANKSDLTTADGYTAMSTQSGDGIDVVLESILSQQPKRTEEDRLKEIRAPIVHAEDAPEIDPVTGRVKRKRIRRPRKPRTKTE
ncbi:MULTISPECIES: GTPase [unclassified Methanoregula]|uniref:NOG1 family protein n=1 Tax=unclassified Methanoregula TaxID=2649730 RepID=UPI0009C8571E|nr:MULTISPECIES: GTPase [unclassified Methanoregula]OPX64894.1 MAG: tRNA modification GTPase TrmE [Methanoregula sp. PtaB.Bin085]OPY32946.1 MAG: tRNA modification GTPase TrmE [Methanoregula sp. PtaU1.Bin006]